MIAGCAVRPSGVVDYLRTARRSIPTHDENLGARCHDRAVSRL